MPERPINPANGKFTITGRRNIDIDLGNNDVSKFVVVQKDMDPTVPAQWNGVTIDWFVSFGVRVRNADGSHGNFAAITYNVTLDPIPAGKRLFAFYNGRVQQLTFQAAGNKIRFSLNVGDPPVGIG